MCILHLILQGGSLFDLLPHDKQAPLRSRYVNRTIGWAHIEAPARNIGFYTTAGVNIDRTTGRTFEFALYGTIFKQLFFDTEKFELTFWHTQLPALSSGRKGVVTGRIASTIAMAIVLSHDWYMLFFMRPSSKTIGEGSLKWRLDSFAILQDHYKIKYL